MLEIVLLTIVIASFVYFGGSGFVVLVLAVAFYWWTHKAYNRQQDAIENHRYETNREIDLMLADLRMTPDELESMPLPTQKQLYDEWKRQKQDQIAKAVAERMQRASVRDAQPPRLPAPMPPPVPRPRPDLIEDEPPLKRPARTAAQESVAAEFREALKRRNEPVEVRVDVDDDEPISPAEKKRLAEAAHRRFVERQERERRKSFGRYMRTRGQADAGYDRLMADSELVANFERWHREYDD